MLAPVQSQSLYKFGDGAAEDQPWMYENVWAAVLLSALRGSDWVSCRRRL